MSHFPILITHSNVLQHVNQGLGVLIREFVGRAAPDVIEFRVCLHLGETLLHLLCDIPRARAEPSDVGEQAGVGQSRANRIACPGANVYAGSGAGTEVAIAPSAPVRFTCPLGITTIMGLAFSWAIRYDSVRDCRAPVDATAAAFVRTGRSDTPESARAARECP